MATNGADWVASFNKKKEAILGAKPGDRLRLQVNPNAGSLPRLLRMLEGCHGRDILFDESDLEKLQRAGRTGEVNEFFACTVRVAPGWSAGRFAVATLSQGTLAVIAIAR